MAEICRRGFIAAAGAALAGGCRLFTGAGSDYDDSLTVFVSDIHVKPESYQRERFAAVVADILAMDPLPRRVICFGDVAWVYGRREDYESSLPLLRQLSYAGIEVTLGMGNHDHRRNFLDVWPEYGRRTLVSGRIVTRTDLGPCDLLMLDTLWENHLDETRMCKVPGQLTGDQWDWFRAEVGRLSRPTFVASHHPIREIEDGDWKAFNDLLMASPMVAGYIHGHDHVWKGGLFGPSGRKWADSDFKRWLCLPSTGHWGDIGYVKFRTSSGCARAELVETDHYFPNPDARGWIDREIVRERQGAFYTFRFGKEKCVRPVICGMNAP